MTSQDPSKKALGYWAISLHFLRLVEASCAALVATNNAYVVVSELPLLNGEYEDATRWSDHSVGIAVLFNFFHGIELLLKGFISIHDKVPNHHQLTKLLDLFEKSYKNTELANTVALSVREIDKKSPLGKFMTENTIRIDSWYEAFKYPESNSGKIFTHLALKYGGPDAAPSWQMLGDAAITLRLQAVKLSHQLGYS